MPSIAGIAEDDPETFPSSIGRRAWVYAGILFVLLLSTLMTAFWWTVQDPSFAPFAGLLAVVILYSTLFLLRVLFRTRLEISRSGLAYYCVQYDLSASWNQITKLEENRILGIWPHQVLYVVSPTIKSNRWFDPPPKLGFLLSRDQVPIGPRLWERNEELLERVRRYAPQIDAAA